MDQSSTKEKDLTGNFDGKKWLYALKKKRTFQSF